MNMTVYGFAKKLMEDKDFECGGIAKNEKKWADAVGFDYSTDESGNIECSGDDMAEFYEAMFTLWQLNRKYKRMKKEARDEGVQNRL